MLAGLCSRSSVTGDDATLPRRLRSRQTRCVPGAPAWIYASRVIESRNTRQTSASSLSGTAKPSSAPVPPHPLQRRQRVLPVDERLEEMDSRRSTDKTARGLTQRLEATSREMLHADRGEGDIESREPCHERVRLHLVGSLTIRADFERFGEGPLGEASTASLTQRLNQQRAIGARRRPQIEIRGGWPVKSVLKAPPARKNRALHSSPTAGASSRRASSTTSRSSRRHNEAPRRLRCASR